MGQGDERPAETIVHRRREGLVGHRVSFWGGIVGRS